MPKETEELTDQEREKIRRDKIKRTAFYQQRLDRIWGPKGRVEKWDQDVEKKSDSAKRMWDEGKRMMEIYAKKSQTEIDLIHGFPEENWKNRTDNFRRDYAHLKEAYNLAVSKIRYEKPIEHFKQIPGVDE